MARSANNSTTKRSPGASPLGPTLTGAQAGVTKRTNAAGTGQQSLALKARRYIDININDVRNERARGKWTEEDERKWRSTKPYECEICGERGSTRYNIENRHKVNRHFPQKVIPCPDCKLMFTRKDNLIKHQKKAHAELFKGANGGKDIDGKKIKREESPPKRMSSLDNSKPGTNSGEIKEMIKKFRTFFAPDLPPNPVAGLGKYYNPKKLPFLPPQLLTHYVDYYFDPSAFHNHVPMLHKPTFAPKQVMASFLRAVCALGGLYDPTNKTLSGQLWESGWKVMERWVEKGLEDDDDKPEPGKDQNILKEDDHLDKAERERREREQKLAVLQGFIMFVFYGTFSGDKVRWTKAARLHQRCVEIAREYGYFKDIGPIYNLPQYAQLTLHQQWALFIECESKKRVAFTLFLADCHLAMLLNQPRLVRTSELKYMSFPCDDSLYEAETAEEWNAARLDFSEYEMNVDFNANYAPHYTKIGKEGRTLMFWDIFRALLRGDDSPGNPLEGARVNDFSAYILIMALHMEILSLTQRVADEEEGDAMAGEKPLVFFPREKQAYIDKLRKALNALGRISRFGHILQTERLRPMELMRYSLGFEGVYDHIIQTAAAEVPKLKGCAKTFYLAWHLAHIHLVVPDRMVLGSGDVPLTMMNLLRNLVRETKDRVESNVPININAQANSTSWFEQAGGLEGHLYAVLRYLGRSTGIEDEYRNLEFPTAGMMSFKALMVVWEILVRANREEEQTRSWQLGVVDGVDWGMGLNVSPDYLNQKLLQQWHTVADTFPRPISYALIGPGSIGSDADRRSRETGEYFVAVMNEFVRLQEELEGDDPVTGEIAVRFLRWVNGVFKEMDCWDVGRVVSACLEKENLVERDEY